MMDDGHLKEHLQELIRIPGLSGREYPLSAYLQKVWEPLLDQLDINPLGSLQGLIRGEGPDPRPSVLFAGHMDAIGLMVSGITGDFLRVSPVGGIDARVLPGQEVIVHGVRKWPGILNLPPKSLLPASASKNTVEVKYLLVDVGLPHEELKEAVNIGDGVTFRGESFILGEGFLAGPSLDNRSSIAALTSLLYALQSRSFSWDVWVVATSQEEENMSGALTSAYAIAPDVAVAVDVTFATGPGAPDHKSFPLAQGITLGWGPSTHPALYQQFERVAEQEEIPVTLEPLPARSGTDADVIQISGAGVPTMLLSIPLRYMHTPVEMVAIQSIQHVAKLAKRWIESLGPESLETFAWDE